MRNGKIRGFNSGSVRTSTIGMIVFILTAFAGPLATSQASEMNNSSSAQCTVRVVANEVVVSDQERRDVAFHVQPAGIIPNPGQWPYFAWSDSPLGVTRTRDGLGYLFFGSDGHCHLNCNGKFPRGGSITVSQGTLDHPLGEPLGDPNPPVNEFLLPTSSNLPDYMDYVGGGPVYRVPEGELGAGNLLLVYHVERSLPNGYFWTWIGLAKSADEGSTWQNLSIFLSFSQPYNPKAVLLDMGLGNLVVANDPATSQKYFYIYFPEFYWLNKNTIDPRSRNVSVARAPYQQLLAVAFGKDSTTVPQLFHKYYNGEWNQPGLGGQSTDLFADAQGNGGNPQVSWSDYRKRFVMIMDNGSAGIAYGESPDGLHWPPLQTVFTSSGTPIYNYANAIGLGDDPGVLGDTFYSYYTSWPQGTSWQPATLNRLTITTAATVTAIEPTSTTAGGSCFTLTVNGNHFVKDSIVMWNGSRRPTTYISSKQLTAEIPASDIMNAGTANVTVWNPPPCGGVSRAELFTVD